VCLFAGRTDFYDDVGVIRDVMQNHLTEILTLIAADLPADSGNISSIIESKVRVLGSLQMAGRGAVLTGQYTTYNLERLLKEQLDANDSSLPMRNMSRTPTFAAVVLNVDNDRWRSVPFVLVSGKKLDEKTSYVRIRFRASRFCMRGVVNVDDAWCNQVQQMLFRIGDSPSRRSLIAVSKGLPAPKDVLPGWSADRENEGTLFGQNVTNLVRLVADAEADPYVELIEAVMTGSRHLFVSTDSLLASWKIWTNVLKEAGHLEPRQYMGRGKDAERLDLLIAPPGSVPALQYWISELNLRHFDAEIISNDIMRQIPSTFRNSTLVSGTGQQVVEKLTQEILRLATDKISGRNKNIFHIAFSGGKTPEMVFQRLALAPLPWEHVHVWMVDERCDGSNFENLERHLLSKVNGLRHQNIHPMVVEYADKPCDPNAVYRIDQLYEAAIRRYVPDNSFDFIVLGLGTDGHTASLFPGQKSLDERDSLVTLAETGIEYQQRRITLTLSAVNKAKNVAVLVTGIEKNSILRRISELTDNDPRQYPISGVSVTSWFVDNDALLGRDGRL
jgi:hexose-6-phosphate dehydrogenase